MAGENDPEWEPTKYCDDHVADALYNVAAAIFDLSKSVNGLLYGLKYGKNNGVSIAEAIELGAISIGEDLKSVAQSIEKK